MLAQCLSFAVDRGTQRRMTPHESIDPLDIDALDRESDILDLDCEQPSTLPHNMYGPTSGRCAVAPVTGVHLGAGTNERVDHLAISIEGGVVERSRAGVVSGAGQLWVGNEKRPHSGDVVPFDRCDKGLHLTHAPASSRWGPRAQHPVPFGPTPRRTASEDLAEVLTRRADSRGDRAVNSLIRIVPKRDDAPAVSPGLLVHLGDLDEDYMVIDPVPDFRDWPVTLPDGSRIGKVDDLIIDTSSMAARYLEVHVSRDVHLGHDERWILVPVEAIHVDADQAHVVMDHLPRGGLNGAPRQRGRVPTNEEQRVIHAFFELESVGIGHR